MKPVEGSNWHILLYSSNQSNCNEWVKELLNRPEFSHCKFLQVDSLPDLNNVLSQRFNGVLLVHLTSNSYGLIKQAVSVRNDISPQVQVVALLDHDALNLDSAKLLSTDIDDVVHCTSKEWLQATLLKYYFTSKADSCILPYAPFDRYSTHVDRIHSEFPFGIVRVILKPDVYVEYVNMEAERILGYSLEQHKTQPELRNRFIPDERIKLILENAGTNNEFIKRRFKISIGNENCKWVEAIYIPGFKNNQSFQSIEVILRDVTREEIDKALQKAVYDISRMTSTNFSLNRIFTVTHKIISDLINIDNFYIALYNSENNEVSFPYFVDSTDIKTPNPRRDGHGLTEYVIRTGKTLLCQPSCFDELIFKNEIDLIGTKPVSYTHLTLPTIYSV